MHTRRGEAAANSGDRTPDTLPISGPGADVPSPLSSPVDAPSPRRPTMSRQSIRSTSPIDASLVSADLTNFLSRRCFSAPQGPVEQGSLGDNPFHAHDGDQRRVSVSLPREDDAVFINPLPGSDHEMPPRLLTTVTQDEVADIHLNFPALGQMPGAIYEPGLLSPSRGNSLLGTASPGDPASPSRRNSSDFSTRRLASLDRQRICQILESQGVIIGDPVITSASKTATPSPQSSDVDASTPHRQPSPRSNVSTPTGLENTSIAKSMQPSGMQLMSLKGEDRPPPSSKPKSSKRRWQVTVPTGSFEFIPKAGTKAYNPLSTIDQDIGAMAANEPSNSFMAKKSLAERQRFDSIDLCNDSADVQFKRKASEQQLLGQGKKKPALRGPELGVNKWVELLKSRQVTGLLVLIAVLLAALLFTLGYAIIYNKLGSCDSSNSEL